MKFDQLAYVVETEELDKRIKSMLGLQNAEWVTDNVRMKTWCLDQVGEASAVLQFNTTLNPHLQLELLRPKSGPSWHALYNVRGKNQLTTSHHGFHLEDGEPWPDLPGAPLIQITRTLEHTSDYLTKPDSPGYGRTYEYRIYHMGADTFWKFIRRIPREERFKNVPEILK